MQLLCKMRQALLSSRLPIGPDALGGAQFPPQHPASHGGAVGVPHWSPVAVRVASFLLALVHTPRGDLGAADGGLGSG